MEWGWDVTHQPGRYDVWGPIATPLPGFGPSVVAGLSVPLGLKDATHVGRYHTHPDKITEWSREDVTLLIKKNSTYTFSVMANCDGTVVRAIVTLKTTIRDEDKLKYRASLFFPPKGKEEAMVEWYDNLLAQNAADLRYCTYKRVSPRPWKSGPLKFIKYDPNVKEPTP